MAIAKYLFEPQRNPRRGLLAAEWVVMAYIAVTLMIILVTYTKLANPQAMFWGRVQVVVMTVVLWGVYRMMPCRFTHLCRHAGQLLLLSWWYPDTYEFSRLLPCLDHYFAQADQQLFGCQPALIFSEAMPHPVVSELMHLGYFFYYPLIAILPFYAFFQRYEELGRVVAVVLASFFSYYIIYIFLPVTGPQYYYLGAGLDNVAQGVFPHLGNYFANHQESLPMPGWRDGVFYQLVLDFHIAGERPTAAFPSSHVGASTVIMLLIWKLGGKKMLRWMMPLYVLLCLSTVYVRAHYVVDVVGGWLSGVLFFYLFYYLFRKVKE